MANARDALILAAEKLGWATFDVGAGIIILKGPEFFVRLMAGRNTLDVARAAGFRRWRESTIWSPTLPEQPEVFLVSLGSLVHGMD